eukprot:PhF_6_TR5107/c0_g1_i1/m.7204
MRRLVSSYPQPAVSYSFFASLRHLTGEPAPGLQKAPESPIHPRVYEERQSWEYIPTPAHKSLVLMIYRNLLKELIPLQTVRRRTLIQYARISTRSRKAVTEKLMIDEFIEEARRSIYIANKMNMMAKTKTFEFDNMYLPKDQGQDVKDFMDNVFDPFMAKVEARNKTRDVVPGKEHLHQRRTKKKKYSDPAAFKDESFDIFRPPPPPESTPK